LRKCGFGSELAIFVNDGLGKCPNFLDYLASFRQFRVLAARS
jgi:hypothetical protein